MSRKDEKKEKKRKRQEDEADDVSAKPKKSKNAEDSAYEFDGNVVTPVKKAKKEKKEKKGKKSKNAEAKGKSDPTETSKTTTSPENVAQSGTLKDATLDQDFIRFDDARVPDYTEGTSNDTGSKKDKKRSKKDNTDKKAKKEGQIAPAEAPEHSEIMKENSETQDGHAKDIAANAQKGIILEKEKKKAKKEKKAKAPITEEQELKEGLAGEANGTEATPEGEQKAEDEDTAFGKKDRFIVFVGNLPYTATKEQVEVHFAKINPSAIRLQTDKKTGKPRGIAFVEFDRYDRMQTCLKKYHHSIFATDDKKEGRKINVELSAGGGGNSESRKWKIHAKNEKLHNERQRDREKRDEIEGKQKERKEKKDSRQNKGMKNSEESNEPKKETDSAADATAQEHGGIHPARLALMNQPAPKAHYTPKPKPYHRKRY